MRDRVIRALIDAACAYPRASVGALVDLQSSLATWRDELAAAVKSVRNLKLIVDLDAGMGRTGAPSTEALRARDRVKVGSGVRGS
jgi:hypothetical protein